MAIPIYAATIKFASSNTGFFTLLAQDPTKTPNFAIGPQMSCVQLDLVSWHIQGGSTGAGTIVGFQEFLPVSPFWFNLSSPAQQTLVNSADINGILNGPFFGVRLILPSTISGNGVGLAVLKATVRAM